ncbi:MAG TPA: hypothetical protein DEP42_05675 [Ruminococcaceae bacterium]|nr:hypothetical protein [Oscillospiraceae bacterium]
MYTISACIFSRGDSVALAKTLTSCNKQIDEFIVAVPDKNKAIEEIAQKNSAVIVPYQPQDSICLRLTQTFAQASGDYLFWIDAGDILTPLDLSKLSALKLALHEDISAVRIRHAFPAVAEGTFSYYRYETRMISKKSVFSFEDDRYPILNTPGDPVTFDMALTHPQSILQDNAENLPYYQKRLASNTPLSPHEQLFYARALRDSGNLEETLKEYEALIERDAPKNIRLSACLELSVCQSDIEERLGTLYRSFQFSSPEADICCAIGHCLQKLNAQEEAIFWYELALSQKMPISERDIYYEDWNYIPSLELCCCYHAIGNKEKAKEYNHLAAEYKPHDETVQSNAIFFRENEPPKKTRNDKKIKY